MRTARIVAALCLVSPAGGVPVLHGSRKPDRVRIAYAPILASLPVFVAQDQQMFQQHRLQAEMVSFSSSNDMVSGLVAGQVDVLPAVSLVPLLHLEIQYPGKISRVLAQPHAARKLHLPPGGPRLRLRCKNSRT